MSEPYIGEIRIWPANFAPLNWALCEGQVMAIAQNTALFQLIGTTYGGDGQATFNLPDLRSRVPVHVASSFILGAQGGLETISLIPGELPLHTHAVSVVTQPATSTTPTNSSLLADETQSVANSAFTYAPSDSAHQVGLATQAVTFAGSSQPHDNLQPYLGLNFIIALFGIFPSQN